MEAFNKEIIINDKKKVKYDVCEGYTPTHIITDVDLTNNVKTLKIMKYDDYAIKSWNDISFEEYQKAKNELHIFEKNHPLYIPLLHLLDGKRNLIIDDDDTYEVNKKFLKVFYNKKYIGIDFINELEEDDSFDKFSVFIKNIGFDLRSKIDCGDKDTKERLYMFFNEVYNLFSEEYHQMTIEEYLLEKGSLDLK